MLNFLKLMFNNIIRPFLMAVFTASRSIVIAKLADIAIYTVTELKDTQLSNEEKRNEAIKRIKQYAIDKGIEAKDSIIALVVEMAVAKMKG